MIAMIIRHTGDGNVYEFIERQNVWYIGKLLTDEQINNLRKFNNTVISYKMLKQLGEAKILDEIEALTARVAALESSSGSTPANAVYATDEDGKSVIVWRKPEYLLDTKNGGDYYILYITNYGDEPVEQKRYIKYVRDKEGKVLNYVTQDDVKKWLKADGYTAVKFKEI